MTYQSTSSAEYFSIEEREEQKFLRNLKGVLRLEVAQLQERENLTRLEVADRINYDPAQLSRILSVDRHNSTHSIFLALYRLGKRWTFGSMPLPNQVGNALIEEKKVQASARATLAMPSTAGSALSGNVGANASSKLIRGALVVSQ